MLGERASPGAGEESGAAQEVVSGFVNSHMRRCHFRLGLAALAVLCAGCASRPTNDRIFTADATRGYRMEAGLAPRSNNDGKTILLLAFSGGGTRAAALSYGVLEALRNKYVLVDGQRRRLLDEVDVITGVSGGSFTALAYAFLGERLFSEYEERFLKRDVQGALIGRAVNPLYWPKLVGGSYGRSELAADYYDEILFEGATFGDLLARGAPVAFVAGTDLSTGARLEFSQSMFDVMCSDLLSVRLSRAAASSSAVPLALSPVTFDNYGGTCGFEFEPRAVYEISNPSTRPRPAERTMVRLREHRNLERSNERPYIHVVDGGVADNLGLRGVIEALEILEASPAIRRPGRARPRRTDRNHRRKCPRRSGRRLGPQRVTAGVHNADRAGLRSADRPLFIRVGSTDQGHRRPMAHAERIADSPHEVRPVDARRPRGPASEHRSFCDRRQFPVDLRSRRAQLFHEPPDLACASSRGD